MRARVNPREGIGVHFREQRDHRPTERRIGREGGFASRHESIGTQNAQGINCDLGDFQTGGMVELANDAWADLNHKAGWVTLQTVRKESVKPFET